MKHLEPKVKRKSSFSILFLRDDSSVVRFRVKPFWVKFFVVFLAMFSISSGIAGYAAHYYWKKYNTLRLEQGRLTATLDKNRRKLDEFAGMERVEAALPRSSMSSVSVAAVNGNGNGNGSKPQASSENGAPAASNAPQASTETPKTNTSSQPATQQSSPPGAAPQGPQNPPASQGNGQSAQSATPAVASPDSQTTSDPPEKKEHPAFIDEVQIRQSGAKRYSLSFGLSNRDKQIKLNGRVHVSVTDKGGKRYEITQINRDALRFVINNYKKVVTAFSLPPELDVENASRVNLMVTAEDVPNVTYSFTIPPPPPPAPAEETDASPQS